MSSSPVTASAAGASTCSIRSVTFRFYGSHPSKSPPAGGGYGVRSSEALARTAAQTAPHCSAAASLCSGEFSVAGGAGYAHTNETNKGSISS